jgi:hypothetical protein
MASISIHTFAIFHKPGYGACSVQADGKTYIRFYGPTDWGPQISEKPPGSRSFGLYLDRRTGAVSAVRWVSYDGRHGMTYINLPQKMAAAMLALALREAVLP